MHDTAAMYTLIQRVEQTAGIHGLWTYGDTIVVAVSGGPDSMALLHVLHYLAAPERYRLKLIVAHVNHGFREESHEEAHMVARVAGELGLPCEMTKINMPAIIQHTGMNGQAAAREQRYAFLHHVAEQYGATHLALAHHADDQAETVMMRLIRGSGASGLAGMAIHRTEKKLELIRPFLRINKTDLMAYCDASGIAYAIDQSNDSRKYVRNQIRLDVLPFLGQYNQQITKALNRTADLLGADNDYLEQVAVERLQAIVKSDRGGYRLERKDFQGAHVALQRRFIKLILSYLAQKMDSDTDAFDYDKIEAIRQGIIQTQPTTWKLDISEHIECIRAYEHIDFIHKHDSQDPASYLYRMEQASGEQSLPADNGLLRWEGIQQDSSLKSRLKPRHRYEAYFDANSVKLPLIVRNRRPGDRMRILGLNGTKKVQDIFIDDKIAPNLREQWPVITDATDTILWIPGIRRSSHAIVEEDTTQLLRMELCKQEGSQHQL
jgi:tRNA(Ile)-lysidine synthase